MILNDEWLHKGLLEGMIFTNGSWLREQVKGAAYDLRLAGWPLVTPDGRKYDERDPRHDPFVLEPGDVVSVASVERFTMPGFLTATISLKFSAVRRGLLVLHGGMVHPGFGATREEGEPVYFLVANVSRVPVSLYPEVDSLASVQFHWIDEVEPPAAPNSDVRAWAEQAPDEQLEGLQYFEDIKQLRKSVDQIGNRTRDVVVFGVFVLAFALVGAIAAALVALLGDHAPVRAGRTLAELPTWAFVVICSAGVVAVIWALVAAWYDWFPARVPDAGTRVRAALSRDHRRRQRELADDLESVRLYARRVEQLEAEVASLRAASG